jgi:hypothetical protein
VGAGGVPCAGHNSSGHCASGSLCAGDGPTVSATGGNPRTHNGAAGRASVQATGASASGGLAAAAAAAGGAAEPAVEALEANAARGWELLLRLRVRGGVARAFGAAPTGGTALVSREVAELLFGWAAHRQQQRLLALHTAVGAEDAPQVTEWAAREAHAAVTALLHLASVSRDARAHADVAMCALHLAASTPPDGATDADAAGTADAQSLAAAVQHWGMVPEAEAAVLPADAAHRQHGLRVAAGGLAGVMTAARERYGGLGVVSQATLRQAALWRLYREEQPGPERPHSSDVEGLMRASGYRLRTRHDFVPRAEEPAGASPYVRGGALFNSHLPWCDACRAVPARPCAFTTLAHQVDYREPAWLDGGPPEAPPVGNAIPWQEDALRAGLKIVRDKYLPGRVLVPVAEAPSAATPGSRGGGGGGGGDGGARGDSSGASGGQPVAPVSGGSALASFIVNTVTLVVPPDVLEDAERLFAWVDAKAASAVERLSNVAHAQWRVHHSHLPWYRFRDLALAVGDVTVKPRIVLDARPLNAYVRPWRFRLAQLSEILAAVRPGYWAGVRDLKSGYNHIRMADSCYRYVRTHLPGDVDTAGRVFMQRYEYWRQPFGESSAVAMFSALSAYLLWLCRKRGLAAGTFLFAYIDDITIVAPTQAACQAGLELFHVVCGELGVMIEDSKSQGPAQRFTVLGVTIDTRSGELSLPPAKVAKRLLQLLVAQGCVARQVSLPKRWLRKLLGTLENWTHVLPTGRAFLTRLWGALSYGADEDGAVPLHLPALAAASAELAWWVDSLRTRGLRPMRLMGDGSMPVLRAAVTTTSDAAGEIGWGLVMGPVAMWGLWRGAERHSSSSYKELVPLEAPAHRYGPQMAGRVLLFLTDNAGNAAILNRGRSHGDGDAVVKRLAVAAQVNVVTTVGLWLPREANEREDSLSRCATYLDACRLCRVPVVRDAVEYDTGLALAGGEDALQYGRRHASWVRTACGR